MLWLSIVVGDLAARCIVPFVVLYLVWMFSLYCHFSHASHILYYF